MCVRRLVLLVMMRGALSESMFQECVTVLLDAFGAHHIHTLTALEAAGPLYTYHLCVRVCVSTIRLRCVRAPCSSPSSRCLDACTPYAVPPFAVFRVMT